MPVSLDCILGCQDDIWQANLGLLECTGHTGKLLRVWQRHGTFVNQL